MNKEKKQVVTPDNLKEIAVMTIAVGIIAAAVYFRARPRSAAYLRWRSLLRIMYRYMYQRLR